MVVEQEKLQLFFPQFRFLRKKNQKKVSAVAGKLKTNNDKTYDLRIKIDDDYPYSLPDITLPKASLDGDCPHKYSGNRICVMRSEHWTSTYSLAFLVAKGAIWLNKYEVWLEGGKERWPGKDQHR